MDETYHWRAEINGDGYIAKSEHVNKYGRCECGKYFECTELVFEPARDVNGNLLVNEEGHYGLLYLIFVYVFTLLYDK